MKLQELKDFFDRPGIEKKGICQEAGITPQLLSGILRGKYSISKKTESKLKPILKKYGYETT